ncbi:MAG: CDC27 family protein [Melioribacteraceae bacterium]
MNKQIEKKISSFQFLYILTGLIGLGIFLLISSGVFNSAPIVARSINKNSNAPSGSNQSFDEIHSGANLTQLNKIKKIEEDVKNNPNNFESLLSLAHQLNDNGFYEKAIVNYEKYLKKFSKNTNVIVDYGVCYFELKKYDKSISILKSALQIEPKHQIAHFNLGIVNFSNNDMQAAKNWLEKTVEIDAHSEVGHKAKELLNTQLRSE